VSPERKSEKEFERLFEDLLREDREVAWLHSNYSLLVEAGILLDLEFCGRCRL
jgi:hypothetical protein